MDPQQKSWKAAIITHEATTGPAHDVRDFLKDRMEKVFFIAHPLLFIPSSYNKSSYYEIFESGILTKRHQAFHWPGPELLLYLKDVLYSLWWIARSPASYDLIIGSGNLNALVAILLRKLGKTKKVVFYCVDYVPRRFSNKIVNGLYHWIDKVAADYSDATWNLSPRMAKGREDRWRKKFANQLTVPVGVYFGRIKRLPFDQINRHQVVYMGTLLEKQGVQLVIQALPTIAKTIANIHFLVIGSGPFEGQLKSLTKRLGLESMVTFAGYVQDHRQVENMLAQSAVAVAMYDKNADQFTYFADPAKIKNYLASAVPVVTTDVPYIAQEIANRRCGLVISYDVDQLIQAVTSLLRDDDELRKYRQNATDFAQSFEWSTILESAFSSGHLWSKKD